MSAPHDLPTLLRAHDARVTELLEANNREVERRRAAEARLAEQPHDQGVYQDDPIGDLRLAARTIRSWIPEVYPADEQGRVPFVRGVLESVAAAIDRAVPVLPPPGPVPMHELPDDEIEALQAYARAHPATAELRAMVGEFQADRAAAERTSDEAAAARAATELHAALSPLLALVRIRDTEALLQGLDHAARAILAAAADTSGEGRAPAAHRADLQACLRAAEVH